MKTAMPSPRGTNLEQLFLPSRGPLAAYDDAGGLMDDATLDKIMQFLAGKLDEADLAKARELLEAQSMMSMDGRIRRQVVDAIGATNEKRDASFAARFPDAARIGVIGLGGDEQRYGRGRG